MAERLTAEELDLIAGCLRAYAELSHRDCVMAGRHMRDIGRDVRRLPEDVRRAAVVLAWTGHPE